MSELVGVAHAHLRNALDYTLLIPATESGIRRFCLWAIGLAVLTLKKIHKNPGFTSGAQVKISRRAVSLTRLFTDLSVRNDWLLRRLFARAARGLPVAALTAIRCPQPTRLGHPAGELPAAHASEPARRRSFGGSGT
jgi:farnesyl-diphosphate farnesyltransferase